MTENQVSEQQSLSTEDVQKMWDEEAIAMVEDPVDPTPEPEPEPEPAPKLESDPFRDLPPELLARIDSLHKANEDLKNHVRAAEGRVAAWQREREEQKLAAPTQNELVKATANPEKWEQLKQDFPEWAEAMEEYVGSKVGGSSQGVSETQLNKLIEERTGKILSEAMEAIEYSKLETKHSDWKETINSDNFVNWINSQPVNVYNLIDSPKAADAAKVIDLFKAAKVPTTTTVAEIKNQRKATLSNAVVTKPGESRQSKTLDNMTPEELWNYEARQRSKKNEQQRL
jgi:hypothetical protein